MQEKGLATVVKTADGWAAAARTELGLRRATFGFGTQEEALEWVGEDWELVKPEEDELLGRAAQFMQDYFDRKPVESDFPLDFSGIPRFTRGVLAACHAIPYGKTASYGDLARAAGSPGAARAAGQAMARNPMGLVIPCHRTIGSDGSLTGFGGGTQGLPTKERMLRMEREVVEALEER